MIAAIFLAQIVMIGVFGIKQVPAPSALILPLPFITLYFRRTMLRAYHNKTEILPLDAATQTDAKLKELGIGSLGAKSAQANEKGILRESVEEFESGIPEEQKAPEGIELDKRKEETERLSVSTNIEWNPLTRKVTEPATPQIMIGAIPHDLLKELHGDIPRPELFIQKELQASPVIDPKTVGAPSVKSNEKNAIPDRV